MRINAEVVVTNRSLCSHNLKGKAKPARSSLALGGKKGEFFMMLCTAQNRAGTKYPVSPENVERVFTKFVHEGKATVRLKDPQHDVCITKCDVVQLKAFLGVLRKVLEGKEISDLSLSAIQPASASQVAKPKTRLVINEKKDYPITTGFPTTLETLIAQELNLKRIDSRIFKLRGLSVLNLSHNVISNVPVELAKMKSLRELHLVGNQIDTIPHHLFLDETLSSTLSLLDLSKNRLKFLPNQICSMKRLVTLKLDGNLLERLPFLIGKVGSLRALSVAGNKLQTLPGSLARATLDTLDLSNNPLRDSSESGKILFDNLSFPSLLDICLLKCIKAEIRPAPGDLPGNVLSLFDSHQTCRCGRPCFTSKAVVLNALPLSKISSTYLCDVGDALFEAVMCSKKCADKYSKNPFAF